MKESRVFAIGETYCYYGRHCDECCGYSFFFFFFLFLLSSFVDVSLSPVMRSMAVEDTLEETVSFLGEDDLVRI